MKRDEQLKAPGDDPRGEKHNQAGDHSKQHQEQPKDGDEPKAPAERPKSPGESSSDTPKRTGTCTVLYGSDGAVDPPQHAGFHIAPDDTAQGQITVVPTSQNPAPSAIIVTCKWTHYQIDAERNFFNDIAKLIADAVTAVTDGAEKGIATAINALVDALQPLVNGRRLTYDCGWGFTFTCAATIDGQSDPNHKWKITHWVTGRAGVTSPADEEKIHWGLDVVATVDGEGKDKLGVQQTSKKTGTGAGAAQAGVHPFSLPEPAGSVEVGPGTHQAKELDQLTLEVEGYGEILVDLINTLKSFAEGLSKAQDLGKIFWNLIVGQGSPKPTDLKDLTDKLTAAIRDLIMNALKELKSLLTKTTATIDLRESVFRISC